MGLHYYIKDRGTPRAYLLGKGLWWHLTNEPLSELTRQNVRDRVALCLPPDLFERNFDLAPCIDKIADDVHTFVGSCSRGVELRDDSIWYDDEFDADRQTKIRVDVGMSPLA